MLKNITLSADENLIRQAREKARHEHTTLNARFRQWLGQFAQSDAKANQYKDLMQRLQHVQSGRSFSREELNDR